MKVSFLPRANASYSFVNGDFNKSNVNNESQNTYNQFQMSGFADKRDLIHFGKNSENPKTFLEAYSGKGGFPRFMEALEEAEDEARLYEIYYDTYKNLEECRNIEDLSKYPELRDFGRIKSIKDISMKIGIVDAFKKAYLEAEAEHPSQEAATKASEMLFPEYQTNDFALYLAKKYYGELLPREEIEKDLLTDINPEAAPSLNKIFPEAGDPQKIFLPEIKQRITFL